MTAWLELHRLLERGDDVVAVTVAKVTGSAPREEGATMLVSATDTRDTVGGGRLEWEAVAYARQMLTTRNHPRVLRFPLAASLGQCCGGVVWLAFEVISASCLEVWRDRARILAEGGSFLRELSSDYERSAWLPAASGGVPFSGFSGGTKSSLAHFTESGPPWFLRQLVQVPRFAVSVFGCGHVGEAIVRALLLVHASITWIDTREDVFPSDLQGAVHCITTDSAEEAMSQAAPGSFVLVLTHSHAIDLELCFVGLRRADLCFFGLIGSLAKRTRFEQKLRARGVPDEALSRLVSPIGIGGIRSKEPCVIAASTVAQLLVVKEKHLTLARSAPSAAPHV